MRIRFELLNEYELEDEEFVFIWGVSKDLRVVKVYFMVGVGLDMVTYFRGITGLMLL